MARSVKAMKAKPAAKTPTSAIAVTGFLSRGTSGLKALRKTPRIAPATKIGYFEMVFQKFCIGMNELRFLKRCQF